MSEFSDKLSEYIAKSGSNVYQLAKEASLDRTTLQKTAKGQRLPSLDYIREICQYIKISSKQEEELVRLYKIEKLGHSTVKAWDEIQQIILDIYQLRKNEKSTWHIRFDEVSLKSFNAQIVQKCDSEMDCLKAIMCVMEQELEDPDDYCDAVSECWNQLYRDGHFPDIILLISSDIRPALCEAKVILLPMLALLSF